MARLGNMSFTMRLLAVGVIALLVPVSIAYLAMLHLPQEVADTSVELALRETSSDAQSAIREQRLELRESITDAAHDPEIIAAAKADDADRIRQLLSSRDIDELQVRIFPRGSDIDVGPVYVVLPVDTARNGETVYVWYPLGSALVSALVDDRRTPLAVTHNGHVVAATKGFPKGVPIRTILAVEHDSDSANAHAIKYDNGVRHLFGRPIGIDGKYHLVVSSTSRLEHEAITSPRHDIIRALLLLVVSSLMITLFGAILINRRLQRFSSRAQSLAAGDFAARMPERGHDAFGRLAGSFNSLADDLQLRMGELELLVERYTRTLESIEDGVILWTDEGIQLWNRAAERITGVSVHQLDDHPELVELLKSELDPGIRRIVLPPQRGAARTSVDLAVSSVSGGGTLQTMRDVTAIEQLDATRRNFMATASHELRTPLTSILGFAKTLRDERLEFDDTQRQRFLELIEGQAEQMDRLLEAFLDNHRLANDVVEVDIEEVGLADVVADAVRRARDSVGTSGANGELRVELPSGLAARADRRALVGVVSAILENAWKYGLPPIVVAGSQRGSNVHLTMTDAGPSIDSQHVDRLFDPFYRVDPDMRSGIGGVGLGLFKARKLVEAMGGTIDLNSQTGVGTTVHLELRSAGRRDEFQHPTTSASRGRSHSR